MTETKVKAIVLGGIDYKEKDKLITIFTLEQGIVTVVFRGVKNANAKLKSAKEMFSFGDFILTEGKTNLVISADIIESFYDITKDIKKYYVACAMVEIVKTVLPPKEPNPKIFLAMIKCLNMLCDESINYLNIINKFLISVFEQIGYKFDLNACNNCGEMFINQIYMNLTYGDITCSHCKIGAYVELTKPVYSALRILSITDIEKMSTVKISNEINRQVFEILALNFSSKFNKKLNIM